MRKLFLAGALLLVATPTATAAPSYNSPGYIGTTKAPATAPAAQRTPATLSTTGHHPDLVVDAAGTAHVAWTEDNGDAADTIRYCRLKRAATVCDRTHDLAWAKTYESNDSPSYNVSWEGPKLVSIGDQLAIVDYRYPTVQAKPDGSCVSCTTLLWVSEDGGESFTGPAIVGHGNINGANALAFGADDAPVIGTITSTVSGGTFYQAIHPGRFTTAVTNIGDTGPDQAYDGSLARAGDKVFAAFADLGNTIRVRRIDGLDGAAIEQWSAPSVIGTGTYPRLAGGPRGLFLLDRPVEGKPYRVRRVGADLQAGTPTAVSGGEQVQFGVISQTSAGQLHTAWKQSGGDTPQQGVYLRSSSDGATWGSIQPIATNLPNAGQLNVEAANDGGGFVVFNATGNVNAPGPITASGFGTIAPTGAPGLGNLAGGGDAGAEATCKAIRFNAVHIDATEGCFLKGTGVNARVSVSAGIVNLNGLQLIPDTDVKILIDHRNQRIDTTGKVKVQLIAPDIPPIVLWHGELHVDLNRPGNGATLFDFDTTKYAAQLQGFPIAGRIHVTLQGDGVVIPISLRLPDYMGGVTADGVLRANRRDGLVLDTLRVQVRDMYIGVMQVRDLDISYTRAGSVWTGTGEVIIPGPIAPRLAGDFRFENGRFVRGDITMGSFPGVPVFKGVYWSELRLGFGLRPTQIRGGVTISVLPLAPPDTYTVDVIGDMNVQLGTPTKISMTGRGQALGVQLATAGFEYNSDGYVYFKAGVDFGGDALGIEQTGTFYSDGSHFAGKVRGSVCVATVCPGVSGAISDRGVAACASEKNGPSVALLWKPALYGSLFSCYINDVVTIPPIEFANVRTRMARAGSGTQTFAVAAGTQSFTVNAEGAAGAAPRLELVDPSGIVVTLAPVTDKAASAIGFADDPSGRALFGVRRPAAGTWTVRPAAGSPPASNVNVVFGSAPPTVRVQVAGRGRSRTLTYRVTGPKGVSVSFAEVARSGERSLGESKGRAGVIRFAPGGGPGGRRTIVADVGIDGLNFARHTVGSYIAPPPVRPAKPRSVVVTRRGTTVIVRFTTGPGSARHGVTLMSTDRTKRFVVVTGRVATFRNVHRSGKLVATVQGIAVDGRRGPATKSRVVR